MQGLNPLIARALLAACGDNNSPSNVTAAGDATNSKTKILEAGSALLQGKQPLDALNVRMDGFHFYNGDIKAQMEAHHYCSVVNEDLNQCAIFDGNGTDTTTGRCNYRCVPRHAGLPAGRGRMPWLDEPPEYTLLMLMPPRKSMRRSTISNLR